MRLSCHKCHGEFDCDDRRRKLCDACKPKLQRAAARQDGLSPAMVEAILEHSVRMECAPAWERHPQDWD